MLFSLEEKKIWCGGQIIRKDTHLLSANLFFGSDSFASSSTKTKHINIIIIITYCHYYDRQ